MFVNIFVFLLVLGFVATFIKMMNLGDELKQTQGGLVNLSRSFYDKKDLGLIAVQKLADEVGYTVIVHPFVNEVTVYESFFKTPSVKRVGKSVERIDEDVDLLMEHLGIEIEEDKRIVKIKK